MMKELWNLYDNEGKLTELTHQRGKLVPEGLFHLVVANWIKNDQGLYLIQKRNKPLGGHHNPWSSTAGAALYGESSLQAVHRETKEELGLLLKSDDYRFIERAYFDSYLMDVYETRWNGNSEDILFDPQEVSAVKWASIFEIQDMYITKRFYDRSTNYFSNMLGRE